MNETPDIRARIKSAIFTLIIVVLLWCFLFFVRFSVIVPLVEDGLVIYFEGNNQRVVPSLETVVSERPSDDLTTHTTASKKSKVLTQDLHEAIALQSGSKQNDAPNKRAKKEVKLQKTIGPESLDRRAKEAMELILKGKTDEIGQKNEVVKPGGSKHPTSNTERESFLSNNNYYLNGRRALQKPLPSYPCDQEGVVVVRVVVDKTGKVLDAVPGVKGTTNATNCLKIPAKEAALKTTWEASPQSPYRQIGKIIYHFRIK